MKVHTLIQKLMEVDPEMEILLQIDPEGNGYHDVWGVEEKSMDKNEHYWEEVFDEDEYSERMLIIYP